MENAGAVKPGVLVLTAGLSKPFRRLGKYPAMLQELARHVHEAHPDRGDTHRASVVYKDVAVSLFYRPQHMRCWVHVGTAYDHFLLFILN